MPLVPYKIIRLIPWFSKSNKSEGKFYNISCWLTFIVNFKGHVCSIRNEIWNYRMIYSAFQYTVYMQLVIINTGAINLHVFFIYYNVILLIADLTPLSTTSDQSTRKSCDKIDIILILIAHFTACDNSRVWNSAWKGIYMTFIEQTLILHSLASPRGSKTELQRDALRGADA